jgi:homoserine O-succinyltransferase
VGGARVPPVAEAVAAGVHALAGGARGPATVPGTPARTAADLAPLVIGLVNNMPDAALAATERQFRGLLSAAGGDRPCVLRLIALEQVPRGPAGRALVERRYEGPEVIGREPFDGLIITGTEPRSARLVDEPYWGALEALIDVAQRRTRSMVLSCLAAHAAVLSLDGIERRRLPAKLCGVYACAPGAAHPLTAGMDASRHVPHSRFNDLPEDALRDAGYRILARSPAVGADCFVREGASLLVFLQGHPEYDHYALMREYRRDVTRFLSGERDSYPDMPHGYFAPDIVPALLAYEERARTRRTAEFLAQLPPLEPACAPESLWRAASVRLYQNWLGLLSLARSEHAS